jgi:hypothetical protein
LEKTNDQLQMPDMFFPGKISHEFVQNNDLKVGGNAAGERNRGYKRNIQSHQILNPEHNAAFKACHFQSHDLRNLPNLQTNHVQSKNQL